ncbi:hypothetical protein TRFO_28139 [Tritrichomonas foetus]|uniref:Uncharacterized protein n=1 Tax=Tritrichomonas foetus TaxID=1144522 RepID=A0A1J4K4A0_9EUKA|nr:hypothetical protein TRFO_28139 [Tritrichomonas foetus]|eukprot:OHT04325.1 hypothetical protein TRFO_28139 [Tritrichomonas foetus]
MALQSLRALEQRLLSANENILLNVKRLQDGIPLELNTSANSLTASIKSVIKSNGSILSNGIPLIYDLINSVSIDQILHYYHAICNPIKYDIPYFASCLSLAAHTLFPGFIILVLVMWFHRRDQLPRNFAKKVFKYGTEASSYDESTESGRTIIRNRHNVDSSSESSSNARFMGESSTSEKSPIKDTNRRRRKKVSSSSSSDTSETMSDSEEPPPTANSMEL